MPLESGTRLGPYEVIAPIGDEADERYKATDTRRQHVVALKILPPDVASSPGTKARLERDVRTISALNHPGISAVVDVGHQDPAISFVVAELVEGESLAQRLTRGPLELPEALRIAIAIAESLDQAHRRDVVHRGLNPSVVMLAPSGPKVLDFGVANAAEAADQVEAETMAATRTSVASLMAIPTAAAPYMAPEQFAGQRADARADIFALGAILYEMVTGRPAFNEKTQALLIAAVQTVDPDPASKVRPEVPVALDFVIARCLTKDPRQRIQTAFDVLTELQWIAKGSAPQPGVAAPSASVRKRRDRVVWIGVAAVAALAAALAPSTWARFARAPEPEEVRFVAAGLPTGTTPISLSPDGRWVTASINGGSVIGLALDSVTSQALINGVPFQPFWSADSRSIAYFEAGKLKRADIGGGPPQIICDIPAGTSAGTWNRDGVILFPGASVIQRVLAAGGQPQPVTTLDQSKQETEHVGPVFLPDGRHFLFLAVSAQPDQSAIFVGELDSTRRTKLFASESVALYAPSTSAGSAVPGHVLFSRGDTVFAQAFDAGKLALSGEPIRVASGVPLRLPPGGSGSSAITRSAIFAVSQNGVLAFRTGGAAPAAQAPGNEERRTLLWFGRNTQVFGSVGIPAAYVGLDLSPDGKRVTFHRHEARGGDSWVLDLAQDRVQRLTFDASLDNASPIWSPDGARIVFSSQRNGKEGLYVKAADGSATEELVVESEAAKVPMSWSPDGKLIVYAQNTGAGDVWAVPVTGDKKPFPLLQSPAAEQFPQVSPDGKWLAYQSNETGRNEIYVKPFPDGAGKWQVSTDGGTFPRWRGDSKELYFYLDNQMFAADIRAAGSSVEAGSPRVLFGLPSPSTLAGHSPYHRYAVTADGQRFLVSILGAAPGRGRGADLASNVASLAESSNALGGVPGAVSPVTVVLNWERMLKGK